MVVSSCNELVAVASIASPPHMRCPVLARGVHSVCSSNELMRGYFVDHASLVLVHFCITLKATFARCQLIGHSLISTASRHRRSPTLWLLS